VTFVDTVRSGDLSRSRAAIEAGRGGGPFVDELSLGWVEFGQSGNMDRAAAAFEDADRGPGPVELAWLHLGLARAAVGDFEAADEILSGERVGTHQSQTERVVRARAEILVQLDRRAEALDLLDGYTQRVPDPALLALQARIGAGAEGPYSFVTTWQEGISEVFFTVAQAFGPDGGTATCR
jgi:Tfp pilus assembly protein PilF